MVQKYTILKALTRTSNKGFTLLELLVGMIMTLIIGGLAMSAFVLQIIGDDIKQSGENIINDNQFPVIEIGPNNDAGNMPGSSKITIRRALTTSLSLCETINNASGNTTLIVADDSVTNPTSPCKIRTTLSTTTIPSTIARTTELRAARNYRCQLDDLNDRTDTTPPTRDFCEPVKASPDRENVLAAMSDRAGNIRTFRYLDDVETTPNLQYTLNIASLSASKPLPIATYNIGDPIYLIEERTYTLDNKGKIKLEIDGNGSPQTLISGIQSFNISARLYSDTTAKIVNESPATPCVDNPTIPVIKAKYACVFDNSTVNYNWKNIAGVKVELKAKYDSTGKNAQPIGQELIDINKKLTAAAEFFPRNVMSR
jgi:hypothetical protein